MRRSRIRPHDRFISSSVPELSWPQALPFDYGVDRFGSAFFTRSFTLENLADEVLSALALQHSISLHETLSCQLDIRSPVFLDQSLLKMSFLSG